MQNHLSRLWFLSQGCKQVPLEYTRGIVRWAHPDGYFLNAQGQKVPNDNVNPSSQKCFGGSPAYPKDRASNKLMHILMALAFYGPRPTDPDTGKPCICHHLVPDKLDYRRDNLLCWLTREQHREADRQAACRAYWNTLTLARQRLIYYTLREQKRNGVAVKDNPLFAIQDCNPRPINFNGSPTINSVIKRQKVVIAFYDGAYGTYTLQEARLFGMPIKQVLN